MVTSNKKNIAKKIGRGIIYLVLANQLGKPIGESVGLTLFSELYNTNI